MDSTPVGTGEMPVDELGATVVKDTMDSQRILSEVAGHFGLGWMTWSASAASAPYQCPGRWQCTCWCTRWAWHLRRWVDCSEDATTKRSPMESPEFPQKYSGTQSSDMTCRPSGSAVPGVLFRGRRVQQAG